VNQTASVGAAPEGFWSLFGTSCVVVTLLIVFLAWVASPKKVCKCFKGCWDCKRLRSGIRRMLLVSSLPSAGSGGAGESLEEDWWSVENEEANRRDNNKGVFVPTAVLVNVAPSPKATQ
jgi:hypothetical protein